MQRFDLDCNVSEKHPPDPSLGTWNKNMRNAYSRIQRGLTTNTNISPERIKRLEEIGFRWKVQDHDALFERHCCDLEAFRDIHEHCDVPVDYPDNPSLGIWCSNTRRAYNTIQRGQPISLNLSLERIERLEEIGFKWKILDQDAVFERHCCDLEVFKDIHGHCHVPVDCPDNASLGTWCRHMRNAHRKIQKGEDPDRNLSADRIERLEEIGFKWKVKE